ncbi:MAG: FixH family protein, partial [Chloroflexi bacterium]|nr:FixH family protein [Chloroflexota bacterium]
GAASAETSAANLSEVIPRWLMLLGAAMVVGGYVFSAYVWRPAWRQIVYRQPDRAIELFHSIKRAGMARNIGGSLGMLLWSASVAGNLTLAQAIFDPALGNLLFGTRFGLLWLSGFALALLMILSAEKWEPWLRYVHPLAAAGILLTHALNTHAAAAPDPFLAVFSDWLHLVAACIWIGGLVHFALGLHSVRRLDPASRTRLAAGLVPRFSNVGLLAVGALAFTGLYNASLTVGSFDALFNSEYGSALLLKLWLVLPLIGLAGINFLVLRPALEADRDSGSSDGRMTRHLSLTVTGEMLLGAGVLLAAGSFATLPPARTQTRGLTLVARADDLRVTLSIAPGKVGVNQFDVRLTDLSGAPVVDAAEVALRFTPPPSGESARSELSLENQKDGHYAAPGSHLSPAGQWRAQVAVRRAGRYDAFAELNFSVVAP